MIQRIQSIFLLLAIIAQSVFLAMPVSKFIMEDNSEISLYANGFKNASGDVFLPTWALLILAVVILVLSLFTLFQYKKRILQIRFCIYNMLLNLGMLGMLYMQISTFTKNNEVTAQTYSPATVIPLVIIILLFLAFRGIRKDEVLVKAYERLR